MNYIRPKIATLAIYFFCRFPGGRSCRKPCCPKLQLVPRRLGRGYTPRRDWPGSDLIHRKPAYEFQRPHARQAIFENLYVGRRSESQSSGGARPGNLFFQHCRPERPTTATRSSRLQDDRSTKRGGRIPILWPASSVMARMPRGSGKFPGLGGLAYTYLKRRLEQWGEGYHAAAGPPMPDIAGKLSPNQIDALASYLSFIK